MNGTQPLYRAESQSSMREMVYAVRLGKGLQRTLFVVEFGAEFDDAEIARLLPMLESMRAVPVMDLISALE